MFNKVLLAEDIDSIGYGISTVLNQHNVAKEIVMTQYLDDAYVKFKMALSQNCPFDLVITDLSFEKDHIENRISSGKEFIEKISKLSTNVSILVHSVEDRKDVVKNLLNQKIIKAYVLKGRHGLKYMIDALKSIKEDKIYVSPDLANKLNGKPIFELSDADIEMLLLISQGFTQVQVASELQKKGTKASSLSSIEKRLNLIKDEFKVKTTFQLISSAKDLGLI